MEEKKRRPRLSKSDPDTPLQERTSSETPNTQENIWDINDIAPKRESTDDRRNDRDRPPYNRDTPATGGYERKPWQDRNQGSNDRPYNPDRNREQSGGGGYERKPWQDRNQGPNDRPYNPDRNQGPNDRPYNPDRNRDSQPPGERKPWQDRNQGPNDRPYNPDRNRDSQPPGERRPWQDRNQGPNDRPNDRPYNPDRNRDSQPPGERRPWQDRNQGPNDRPYNPDRNRDSQSGGGYERKPWQDRNQGPNDRPYNPDRNRDSQSGGGGYERKPWQDRSQGPNDRPAYNRDNQSGGGYERKPWQDRSQGGSDRPYNPDRQGGGGGYNKPYNKSGGGFNKGGGGKKPFRKKDEFVIERKPKPHLPSGAGMPLNKYLAHCGVSSRRKAVEHVEQGLVKVNGEVKLEPYYRIKPGDIVICNGKLATVQERMVYVLLNKPKNVITTTDDEHGRATVIDIVDPHFPERLYPVGRLDRDTTGLILITNDGELAQKLSHPSFNVQKQYRIGLRKGLTEADFQLIEKGVELEDGLIEINWIRYAEDHPEHDIVELEISSGRNRIVRRIFESLGYEVFKLDRFYFAGLTKKELPRGSFRELTQREIIMLKHFTGNTAGAVARHKDNDEDGDAIVSEEAPTADL